LVDGHCPGLRGKDLLKYIASGISSDHESTIAEEAQEKLNAGLQIYIREGSAARNLEALLPIITQENAHKICFCTDDRHPADLRDEGHIDNIIRKAIALGLDPILAICIATKHAADHYGFQRRGSIEPNLLANLIVFDDLNNFRVRQTWYHGKLVATNGVMNALCTSELDWSTANDSVHLPKLTEQSFCVKGKTELIRVIGLIEGQLITEELHERAKIEQGKCVADANRDILKMAVIERHHGTNNIGLGFVKGFSFQHGAIASTVGHDAHNVAVVGDNDADMLVAAQTLNPQGGQCVVSDGRVLAHLPLPIAGLMSDEPSEFVIDKQQAVLEAIHILGCPLDDPFMPLSFLPLSVIPKLKLSDLGLVDVEQFQIVPLEV
ncbi:MAG: adenine deaminase C-terminal domain-containing protein, partial [Phycisphaerales bacterium]|nr:adenine deaminase C-terminal domain-containing protein [Phycisphaerales bacterium]